MYSFSIIATWRFDNWEKLMFSECQSLPISRNSVFTHDTINQKNLMFKCSTVTSLFALMDCTQILPFLNQLLRERTKYNENNTNQQCSAN